MPANTGKTFIRNEEQGNEILKNNIMKKILIVLPCLLLLFNGIGAIYGGWNLIIHPDGSSIQLSMDWLKHTPFQNYLIPGIVLFIANGIFSIAVIIMLLFNKRYYPWFIIAQGAILTGWIIIQMLLIRTVHFFHYIMGGMGLALIILGILLLKHMNRKPAAT